MKHYKLNYENGSVDKKNRTYIAKCGMTKLPHAKLCKKLTDITCPECILQLMTDYEQKIAVLEDRYMELFPERPVGEKLQ